MIHKDDWTHPTALSQMLGNSMAANALSAVVIPLIKVIRPELEVVDPWETGSVQHQLRQSAMADDDMDMSHTTEMPSKPGGNHVRQKCNDTPRSRGNPKAWHPDPVQRSANRGIVIDNSENAAA